MRNKRAAFFNRKSYIIAAVIMVVAAFGMTGIYYTQQEKKQEEQLAKEQREQIQQAKAEDAARARALEEAASKKAKEAAEKAKKEKQKEEKKEQETEQVSGIIPPENDNFMDEPELVSQAETPIEPQPEIHFDAEADLNWPLQGNVVLNYSMDQTVYFATLDQYKYNPAVIIQAEVNTPVTAVAGGKITSVTTTAETGVTMTVDMGDGYSAVYGQLKEVPKAQGEYVESGETIGYVSEPTKYYSVEGANLYFELQKEGSPVNPMAYLQ